jgi:hypothetical protein
MVTKRRPNLPIWVGFAIVLLGFLSYFAFFAFIPDTRDVPWANFLLFITGASLLTVGLYRAFRWPQAYQGRISGSILGVVAVLIVALFCYGVFALTKVPAVHDARRAGDSAPPFVLSNTEGAPVRLSDLLQGRRAALLVFYRGYW